MRYSLQCCFLVLAAGLITPVQGAGVLGDITIPRKGVDSSAIIPPAIFPHWKHRMYFKCYVCHNKLFKMQAGADTITMDALIDGKFCAVCHNGHIAFKVGFETCELCHRATPGSAR